MKTRSRMQRTTLSLPLPLYFFLPLLLSTEKAVAQNFLGKSGTGSRMRFELAPHSLITVSSQSLFNLLTISPFPFRCCIFRMRHGSLRRYVSRTTLHYFGTQAAPCLPACTFIPLALHPSTDASFIVLPPFLYHIFS